MPRVDRESRTKSTAPRTGPDEVAITRAVIGAMRKFPKTRLLDFVREHPQATVRDFSESFLGGLSLGSSLTYHAYMIVYGRLYRARKELGLPTRTTKSVSGQIGR